jgi:hypothetical protein
VAGPSDTCIVSNLYHLALRLKYSGSSQTEIAKIIQLRRGLRPYTTRANILPEQTVGRALGLLHEVGMAAGIDDAGATATGADRGNPLGFREPLSLSA